LYTLTTATKKIAGMNKKIRAVQGGTSASKTISILLHLIHNAQSDKKPTLTSVVSESIPHLKRGALRDFKNILKAHNYWKDANWNATDSIYTFETGSQIEFFSTDNGDKLRGGRRDRCFMNEANNCTLDAFDQLEVRTKEYIYLDWNPTNEFFYYTDIVNQRQDVDFVILTYKDNEALSPEIIASIESRKNRKNWWRVYGEGQLGEVEGKVYTDWQVIEDIPHEARKIGRGLDFGYSNDPSACVEVYEYNGGFIIDELFYRKGMLNSEIATLLKEGDIITVADSAEPKSIDEIKLHGITIVAAEKGTGSVLQGIGVVQDQRISVTERSHNILKEYRNYLWERDKLGVILNKPEHGFNHAMDALRYFLQRHLRRSETSVKEFYESISYRQKNRATPRAGLR
jgi:phage terminase large subunit